MRRVFTINQSTTKMPRECAVVGCAELQTKGSLFSFHTFPKDSSRTGNSNWKFFQVGYPVNTHTDMNFLLMVSVTHRRLSLGWSLVDGRNDFFGGNLRPCQFYKEYIETYQRTQKCILTRWRPVQRVKLKKEKKTPSQETFQKKKGKSTKEANVHTNR